MPYRFRKINDVITRVRSARSVATALKLAGQTRDLDAGKLYWPEALQALEILLPSSEELDDAVAAARCTPNRCGRGCCEEAPLETA